MTRRLAQIVALVILCTQGARAQQQAPPTFRAGIEAVEVDAFVTDRAGNPVPHLAVDDFEMLEDGKPQVITSFSEVDIPITPPPAYSAAAPVADVATNSGGEGRLYVIAFDEVDPDDALRARHFLHRFIEDHFEANDIGIVVSIGRARAGDMQDFTANRTLLLHAVDTFSGGFPSEEPPSGRERQAAIRQQARALRDLMESLAGIRGRRKALIYITHEVGESKMNDGSVDTSTLGRANVWDVVDYKGGVRSIEFDDLRAAMTAAMRGGVAFYTFDPSGVDPEAIGTADNLERMGGLRQLAAATGGFAIVNSNSFESAFPRIVAENSNYYVLGFTTANDRRDGRYRKLEVRVKRPGLTVRHRDGYIAPSKRAEPEPAATRSASTLAVNVGDAVKSPLANGTVPMSVFAAAYRGTGKEARIVIAVGIEAGRLDLVEQTNATSGTVEVAAVAINTSGKITRGQRERFTVALKPDTWARVKESGLRLVTGMTLPPGRYQLRVGGGNVLSPQAGSVMYDLDVPDFSKAPLAISPLALTSRATASQFTVAPGASGRPALPAPPALTRDFPAGDSLSVYAEVYDNRTREPHRLELVAELRGADGKRVGRAVTDSRADGQPLQKFEATLPLDVPPGDYVLHVEATSTHAKQPAVSRDVPLHVR